MSGNRGFFGASSKNIDNLYKRTILNTPGIYSYYPFDETPEITKVQDYISKQYQIDTLGTFKMGGPQLRNGSKGSIICPNDGTQISLPTFRYEKLFWSVEYIIKTTSTGSVRTSALVFTDRYHVFVQTEGLACYIGLQLISGGIAGGVGYFLDMSGKARGIWTNSKTIHDDIPHHIVLTWGQPLGGLFDTAYEKIYIDGVLCSVGTTTFSTSTSLPLTGGYQRCFVNIQGNISDLAYYDVELTAEQVLEHYNAAFR